MCRYTHKFIVGSSPKLTLATMALVGFVSSQCLFHRCAPDSVRAAFAYCLELDLTRPTLGQIWSNSAALGPMLARFGLTSAKGGRIRPTSPHVSVLVSQILTNIGRFRPTLIEIHRLFAEFDQIGAEIDRIGRLRPHVGHTYPNSEKFGLEIGHLRLGCDRDVGPRGAEGDLERKEYSTIECILTAKPWRPTCVRPHCGR